MFEPENVGPRGERPRATFRQATQFIRPLVAVAIVVATILAMPTEAPQPQSTDLATARWPAFREVIR